MLGSACAPCPAADRLAKNVNRAVLEDVRQVKQVMGKLIGRVQRLKQERKCGPAGALVHGAMGARGCVAASQPGVLVQLQQAAAEQAMVVCVALALAAVEEVLEDDADMAVRLGEASRMADGGRPKGQGGRPLGDPVLTGPPRAWAAAAPQDMYLARRAMLLGEQPLAESLALAMGRSPVSAWCVCVWGGGGGVWCSPRCPGWLVQEKHMPAAWRPH